jgi:catechol 2,3-dioxygenase-like lactoylglutathione lyase family enzyme
MIQRLSHTTLYVLDQDAAKDFYVNKLGFEVRMDGKMDNGFRWLTVSPKGQPLQAKGVEFSSPPKEQFYGVEAIMKDNSGNWFSMTEPKGV